MKHADKCCQGEGEGEGDLAVALVNTFVSCGSFAKKDFEIDQKPRKALNPLPPKVLWAFNLSCDHRLDCKYKQELSWASCVRTDKDSLRVCDSGTLQTFPGLSLQALPLLLLTVLYGGRLSCMFGGLETGICGEISQSQLWKIKKKLTGKS